MSASSHWARAPRRPRKLAVRRRKFAMAQPDTVPLSDLVFTATHSVHHGLLQLSSVSEPDRPAARISAPVHRAGAHAARAATALSRWSAARMPEVQRASDALAELDRRQIGMRKMADELFFLRGAARRVRAAVRRAPRSTCSAAGGTRSCRARSRRRWYRSAADRGRDAGGARLAARRAARAARTGGCRRARGCARRAAASCARCPASTSSRSPPSRRTTRRRGRWSSSASSSAPRMRRS